MLNVALEKLVRRLRIALVIRIWECNQQHIILQGILDCVGLRFYLYEDAQLIHMGRKEALKMKISQMPLKVGDRNGKNLLVKGKPNQNVN